jgi:cytidylate kinase
MPSGLPGLPSAWYKMLPRRETVIVGRGAQYFLKNREDVLRIFLYAPRDEKVRRLMSQNKSHEEASDLVDTIDRERGLFIKKYFHLPWPDRSLYHAMLNTAMGNESVVGAILNFIHVPAHVI